MTDGNEEEHNEVKPKAGEERWRPAWQIEEGKRLKPISDAIAWTSAAAGQQSVETGKNGTIPSNAGTGVSLFETAAELRILPTKVVGSMEIQNALDNNRAELKKQIKEKQVNAAADAVITPRPGAGDAQLRSRLT